ncbi:MAG TPA: hypothetical protein VN029_07700 [Sphingomonas sp.]|nr:hypothetical protein [Sphingomonas sp.]
MLHTRSLGGTVEIDGSRYDWELLSAPLLSDAEGWRGMTVSLRQHDMPRAAVLEFLAPKRLAKGLPKGRTHTTTRSLRKGWGQRRPR